MSSRFTTGRMFSFPLLRAYDRRKKEGLFSRCWDLLGIWELLMGLRVLSWPMGRVLDRWGTGEASSRRRLKSELVANPCNTT